ncbi:MAG: ferredoxin-thioredoxin reductase catalytic domain-containing protein [Promethearchaeota archaeon]|jgi:ferredoxin-thioredoxin reductase catalytic subunit
METNEGMRTYVKQVADKNNWILNKDQQTFDDLVDGLIDNKKSYGYQSCPCRLASGKRDLDRDLICPCDYAPEDITEYKACYCNLYLSPNFYDLNVDFIAVPERRPIEKENAVLFYIDSSS